MSNRYHITTFGCQMNEHDSEKLAGMLENMGYMESNTIDKADVIILNTCSVRENADLRFFGNLGRLKHLKKDTECEYQTIRFSPRLIKRQSVAKIKPE